MTPPLSPDTKPADPIRVGDLFEIPVKVLFLTRNNGATVALGEGQTTWIPQAALLAGRRIDRPLQVGDRVKTKDWDVVFEIIAVHKLWAWLKDPKDSLTQMALCNLERVP